MASKEKTNKRDKKLSYNFCLPYNVVEKGDRAFFQTTGVREKEGPKKFGVENCALIPATLISTFSPGRNPFDCL